MSYAQTIDQHKPTRLAGEGKAIAVPAELRCCWCLGFAGGLLAAALPVLSACFSPESSALMAVKCAAITFATEVSVFALI